MNIASRMRRSSHVRWILSRRQAREHQNGALVKDDEQLSEPVVLHSGEGAEDRELRIGCL
jgi:hypothetical protein